jgi:hypothetical protein
VQKSEKKQVKRGYRLRDRELAQPLINFLNTKDPGKQWLEKLIDAAARYDAAVMPTTERDWRRMAKRLDWTLPGGARKGPSADRPRPGMAQARDQALSQINSILGKFRLTSGLLYSVRGCWQVSWLGKNSSNALTQSLLILLNLASMGLLRKVKRCEDSQCREWFFQALPHKKFHTPECQERTYEANEERKDARRRWARNYYHNHLSRKGE